MCSDINPWQRIKTQADGNTPENSKTWITYRSTEKVLLSALQSATTYADSSKVHPLFFFTSFTLLATDVQV